MRSSPAVLVNQPTQLFQLVPFKSVPVIQSLPYSNTADPSPALDSHSKNSLTEENHASHCSGKKLTNPGRCRVVSIDMLPDGVLLEIFGIYQEESLHKFGIQRQVKALESWRLLARVCRRWRSVVFGSPSRLDLKLFCTAKTPARNTLDVWPALPISVDCHDDYSMENIIAVLERRDRLWEVELRNLSSSQLEEVSEAMREPFLKLTDLELSSNSETVPILPGSFLGGSAPSLESLGLSGIPCSGLPKLLLSATHLNDLYLDNIPHSGYISPEAMLTALSTLTSLDDLWLGFRSFRYRPHSARQPPPPPARFVLPVLTQFQFEGDGEYLEDLVTYIDAPQLSKLNTVFFNDTIFDTPQLSRFIHRTSRLKTFEDGNVFFFEDGTAWLYLYQLSNVEQVCTSSLPPPSRPVPLCDYEYGVRYTRPAQDSIEDTLWLELLLPFTAFKCLFLSEEFMQRIMPVLPELVGRRTTEVLPNLQKIILEALPTSRHVLEGLQQFIASRQGTSHPIEVFLDLKE